MVNGIAGNRPLATEIVAEIVERTDGVPLFVEELTKAVLEQGQEGRMATLLSASPVRASRCPRRCTPHSSPGSTGLALRQGKLRKSVP